MKKIFLISIIVLLSVRVGFSQTGWMFSNPLPCPGFIKAIKCLDNNFVIACSDGGFIVKTTNSGVNWKLCPSDTKKKGMQNIFFLNQQTGWVCGDSGIVAKTTNGGDSWFQCVTGITYGSGTLNSIYFRDVNTGWTVGYPGFCYKSTNGGTSWTPVTLGTNRSLQKIFFFNQNTGWIVGDYSTIFKTTNGGDNWTAQTYSTNLTLLDVDFPSTTDTGYIGSNGGTLKTTNSGQNWFSLNTGYISYKVKFINNLTGYTAGFVFPYTKAVQRTTDGGLTWTGIFMDTAANFYDFSLINDSNFWAAGYSIQKTTNRGANWTRVGFLGVPSTMSSDVRDLSFVNQNTGFAVGWGSFAMKTTNSGTSWFNISPTFNGNLYSVSFINELTGYAGGNYGTGFFNGSVLKTTNGGINWTEKGVANNLYFASFPDVNTGWFAGNGGTVYKTTNGGNNYSLLTTGTTSDIYFCKFKTVDSGWIAGKSGLIMKSVNGGSTWTNFSYSANHFYCVYNIGNIVWAGSSIGSVFKSSNGGISWTSYPTGSNKAIYDVVFQDSLKGWCCGVYGALYKTTNGGISWIDQQISSYYYYLKIANPAPDLVFVGGYNRVVLKSTTGGNVISVRKLSTEIPEKFVLEQNYPNPFNPLTKIRFDIPLSGIVSVKIYDVLGKEVSTIVNDYKQIGHYIIDFDASELASGVYFYRLESNGFSDVKKMVILK